MCRLFAGKLNQLKGRQREAADPPKEQSGPVQFWSHAHVPVSAL